MAKRVVLKERLQIYSDGEVHKSVKHPWGWVIFILGLVFIVLAACLPQILGDEPW